MELSIVERIGRKKIGYWFRVRVSRREDEGASIALMAINGGRVYGGGDSGDE